MTKPFLLTAVMAVSLFIMGCERSQDEAMQDSANLVRTAKIVPVLSTQQNFTRNYPGTLEASEKADLAMRVSGSINHLPAIAGKRVSKGDLLVQLDDTDYRNTVDERRARFQLAMAQHEQSKKLLKQKLTSQLKFDQTQAELKSAEASLAQAQANLGYTKLYAPFAGVVAQVNIENFQSVQAMSPIIKLQDDNKLDIHFSVPESVISQLKRIQDPKILSGICGMVFFSSHPDKSFNACYRESETVADLVTRNYAALFSLSDVQGLALLPGMTASIEIDITPYLAKADQKRLFVPVEAVFQEQGKQWVWTVDGQDQARKKQVFTGRFEGEQVEITQGLHLQQRIIAAGVSFVREGMRVKPIVRERGL